MFCVNLSKNLVHFVLDLPGKVFGLIGSLCRNAPHGILPGHHQNRYCTRSSAKTGGKHPSFCVLKFSLPSQVVYPKGKKSGLEGFYLCRWKKL